MYINKLFYLVVLLVTLLLVGSGELAAQITVFQTGFEYGNDPNDEPIVIEPKDLNGANGQIGEWSGDEFPDGDGSNNNPFNDTVAFADYPPGGRVMFLDRPTGDDSRPNSEPNSDFTGSYFADLTETLGLAGTTVSFDVGTRRTGGSGQKDYDIIGRASNGDESFHLRVGSQNTRLGVFTDAGNTLNFDLRTVVGSDTGGDLTNIGGPAFGNNDNIGSVSVRLGADGYVIDFVHVSQSASNFNAYTTDLIGYNGNGADLAQIEFTYEASTNTGRNSGYILDNILVTGFADLLLGDFNFDSNVNMADFQVLVSNFHTGTKFDQGDINFDAKINLQDFFEFKQVFQAQGQAATAAVPEPGSLVLLGLGTLLLVARGRR